jgi:protein involved in polysaccharide export with SLBB domain
MKKTFTLLILINTLVYNQTVLTNSELDLIKETLKTDAPVDLGKDTSFQADLSPEKIIIESPPPKKIVNDYFGYDYFLRDISFFDNIPTPADFKLGSGDEVVISLWGQRNIQETFVLNKDGSFFYENIGFINLSNKTLEEAEELLTEVLSKTYSTLKDPNNSTKLKLSLGDLKSVNVFFTGHINNPGVHLIHPFSDIFSAIVQAGGVNNNGSLREVQLIRNNQVIASVDFYSFLMSGINTFSGIKLIDGDTIHIPGFKNRISISGEVNRPSTYELLSNESISDLVEYASGLTSAASSTIILNQIIPIEERLSDDNARTSTALDFKNFKSKSLNNGDAIRVLSISDVEVSVEVFGRVKSPGIYPASRDASLKYILDIAGGFDDPIFRQTIRENEIYILRKDSNQFYALEIITSYKDADKQQLMPNDKIFVYENINYRNSPTFRIEGEVNKPGTYPFKNGITVIEAIEKAGGISELGSLDNVVLFQEFTRLGKDGNETVDTRDVALTSLNFVLEPNSVIKVLPLRNVINVEGNVFNPGLVAYSRNMSLRKAINLAGGYKPYSLKKRTYVVSAGGQIFKIVKFGGIVKRLSPGDTVVVPVNPNPSDFDITAFIADLSSTLANIAAILLIVDNQTN